MTVAAAASISPAAFSGSASNLKSSEGKSVCSAFNRSKGRRWNSCKFQHCCSHCLQFGHDPLSCCLNPSSPTCLPDITLTKLQKEIDLGRIAGPFANRPFPSLQCSPIGLVPKHEPNEFRLIQHLSFPQGQSINDFISKDSCSVNYASFDSAVDLVMASGPGGWLAKSDIKSAFRLLPVSPLDYELLGFEFQGQFYFDRCLPMGCSSSCPLFETFSTFLEFQVKKVSGSSGVTHYLDDFLFIGRSREECAYLLQTFRGMCSAVGVPIAEEKTVAPSQAISYLGLEIDTVHKQI